MCITRTLPNGGKWKIPAISALANCTVHRQVSIEYDHVPEDWNPGDIRIYVGFPPGVNLKIL
jgi:hypothetical protein